MRYSTAWHSFSLFSSLWNCYSAPGGSKLCEPSVILIDLCPDSQLWYWAQKASLKISVGCRLCKIWIARFGICRLLTDFPLWCQPTLRSWEAVIFSLMFFILLVNKECGLFSLFNVLHYLIGMLCRAEKIYIRNLWHLFKFKYYVLICSLVPVVNVRSKFNFENR